jgi:hypothetical protein
VEPEMEITPVLGVGSKRVPRFPVLLDIAKVRFPAESPVNTIVEVEEVLVTLPRLTLHR